MTTITNIWSQLWYFLKNFLTCHVCHAIYQVPLYLWWMILRYYAWDCSWALIICKRFLLSWMPLEITFFIKAIRKTTRKVGIPMFWSFKFVNILYQLINRFTIGNASGQNNYFYTRSYFYFFIFYIAAISNLIAYSKHEVRNLFFTR